MPKMVRKSPYPRSRLNDNVVRSSADNATLVSFSSTPGTFNTTYGTGRLGGYRGVAEVCHDIVTPGFSARSANGDVINNPFTHIKYTCDWGGTGHVAKYNQPLPPWPQAGFTYQNTYPTILLHQEPAFQLPPLYDSVGFPDVPLSVRDLISDLTVTSHTKALAAVDQSNALGLVGLAELRKTLALLRNPLGDIAKYISRWKLVPVRSGRKLIIRDGQGLLPAITNQYLALYYGLKPFAHDLESYLNAYINSAATKLRETARGSALMSDQDTVWKYGDRSAQATSTQYEWKTTHTIELSARSGILYHPTPASLQKGLGLRFGDILPSLYEATPWSFFIDYFSNLGDVIGALSPRFGVTYLAAWDTCVIRVTDRIETTDTWHPGLYTHIRKGTEWAERVLEARIRSPSSPYSHIGFTPKLGNWDDKSKVAAVMALLLQQLGKRVIPPAIWQA